MWFPFDDGWLFKKLELQSTMAEIKQNDKTQNAKTQNHPDILSPIDLYNKYAILEKDSDFFEPVEIPHDFLIYDAKTLYEDSFGCYRKEFDVSESEAKSGHMAIRFDGVYMNSAVWINGKLAGEWKYGYTTFEFDITNLVCSGKNRVDVCAVFQNPNSRWYSGAGIYRDVYLKISSKHYLVSDGVYISTEKQEEDIGVIKVGSAKNSIEKPASCLWKVTVSTETAGFNENKISAESSNKRKPSFKIRHILKDIKKTVVSYHDYNVDTAVSSLSFTVENPMIWDVDSPNVYTIQTQLLQIQENGKEQKLDGTEKIFDEKEKILDETEQVIGFRTFKFDCNKGFFLNGKHLKIHGACMHHDLGALGAAFNKTALERQLEKLKEMGVNAVRTAHNPPAPAFMELTDKMGLLVLSEAFDMWEKSKTTYDYGNFFNNCYEKDVASWIRRDRNHPSLFAWCIGNEIYDTHKGNGLEITKKLVKLVRVHDSRRNAGGITISSNYMEWDGAQNCAGEIDFVGYNYSERLYPEHHKKHPDWCILGTETSSTVQSRGIYHFPASSRLLTHDDLQCSSLGNCSSNWGAKSASDTIIKDRDSPFCIGQFIWSGWDYIGEPTPYFTKNSYFGQIDTAGFKKDTYFLYRAEWTDYKKSPFVHILPYWDFNDGQLIDVRVYSNAPETELFFNGKSQGVYKIDHEHGLQFSGDWQIPYSKGVLKAVARDGKGNVVAEDLQQSFGDAQKIVMQANKNSLKIEPFTGSKDCQQSLKDLVFIEISTEDKNGVPVANARNRIFLDVTGPARIAGLDNGDSTDFENYKCVVGTKDKSHNRKLFSNRLLAILEPDEEMAEKILFNGEEPIIKVTAASEGLESSEIVLQCLYSGIGKKRELKTIKKISHGTIHTDTYCEKKQSEIPVRKIQLTVDGSTSLNPQNECVTVNAKIFPANASYRELTWKAVTDKCIESNSVVIEKKLAPHDSDSCVVVKIAGSGIFRLWCYSENGTGHPEVISELEFSVTGIESAAANPYKLINACTYTSCTGKPILSFQGGVYVLAGKNRLVFEHIDFGDDGSNEITIPIFSFDTELPIEIWDGNPENEGLLLLKTQYKSPSLYNHYQANTWELPVFLTGIHTISIVTETRLSIQGFQFNNKQKAWAKIYAAFCNAITGDMFKKNINSIEDSVVSGIGNNVSLEFNNMDFGEKGFSSLTIFGRSNVEMTTIHVRFTPVPEFETLGTNQIVDFPFSHEYIEKTFSLKGLKGKWNVLFLFLPGSNFDFQWFRFSNGEGAC